MDTTGTTPRAAEDVVGEIALWWTKVLLGQTGQPHAVLGDALRVRLRNGVLHLSGELATEEERRRLIREARQYVGRGLDDVDASRLRVKRRDDARGILDQTLVAAFANPELAEHALDFIREHSRVELKESAVVKSDRDPMLDRIGEFAADARKALALGNGILTLRVDEADAFEARELLDEDTRSRWTMTMPPRPAA